MRLSENYQPVQNGWNEQNHANSQQRQEFKAEFHQEWGSDIQRPNFFKGNKYTMKLILHLIPFIYSQLKN